ncbi:hypothetical protein DPMN_029686 [Dreissena polymorpha]|uniref:Uncharacterized protein n=1 Tax=Dreissena polymorpha TaxID=45954 RepID=A0A9D4LZH9_DREPO|nr:hypothetical protein DPMN_029686 [Dreissena polymorpha]
MTSTTLQTTVSAKLRAVIGPRTSREREDEEKAMVYDRDNRGELRHAKYTRQDSMTEY